MGGRVGGREGALEHILITNPTPPFSVSQAKQSCPLFSPAAAHRTSPHYGPSHRPDRYSTSHVQCD